MMVRCVLHVGLWNSSSLWIDRRWALSEEKYSLEMMVGGILHVDSWNSSSLSIDQRWALRRKVFVGDDGRASGAFFM